MFSTRQVVALARLWHLALAVLAVSSCRQDPGQTAARSNESDTTFKVALLTPGAISDQSWNAGAYQGLLRIRDSLGAHVSHIQTKTPAEFEENFRQYGATGYSLVFGHGFEFQDAAKRVAPEFPHTVYVTTSGTTTGPNLAGISFGFAEASYLAGIVAGSLTRSNRLGMIGGTELPPVVESFRAFQAGARSVNPSVKTTTSYIGNWDDVSAGKEQALAQLSQGIDLIFQNADAAGLGVFQAVRERKTALAFGSNSNQNAVAPDVVIGSVVIDLPLAFYEIAREVKAGTFKPRVVELGTHSHVVTLVLNPNLISRIPVPVRARVDSIQSLMFAGKFALPDSLVGAR
jgi:basic membrane lipoprotein Med (substrate-binding protein (PBP1-ABC) superfamily)